MFTDGPLDLTLLWLLWCFFIRSFYRRTVIRGGKPRHSIVSAKPLSLFFRGSVADYFDCTVWVCDISDRHNIFPLIINRILFWVFWLLFRLRHWWWLGLGLQRRSMIRRRKFRNTAGFTKPFAFFCRGSVVTEYFGKTIGVCDISDGHNIVPF